MSETPMGCADLERLVGVPHVNCCSSCASDQEYGVPICELYADSDDLGPNVPPDAWFSVCCAHYLAFENSRALSGGADERP